MFWLVAILLIIISFWYFLIKPLQHFSKKGVKQTSPWPMFGDSWMTFFQCKSIAEFFEYLYNMFPNERYFGTYQFTMPILVVKDLDLIKQFTIKDFDHFMDHHGFVDLGEDSLLGGILFNLKGQRWREMRATLSSTFTSSKMRSIFGVMTETATTFVEYFLSKNEDVQELEMKDTLTRYTNDVIASAAFGVKVDSLKEPNNQFYRMGRKLTDFSGLLRNLIFFVSSLAPKIASFLKLSPVDYEATEFFRNVLNETIKARVEKGIVRQDVINTLLETRKGVKNDENGAIETGYATVHEYADHRIFKTAKDLSDTDIAAQAIVFFFAGFETISTAMCFGMYELAVNKDLQDKLRQEILEANKQNGGKVTYEILLKLKYMDMVVSEMLRKWSPVVITDRVCVKPYTIDPVKPDEKPIHLKKGDMIWIPIHAIHRNPEYYPEPEKFIPERFAAENKNNIVPYSYLPFGIGPRNCIGSRFALLEMKALLFKLLLNFQILPSTKMTIPLKLSRKSLLHVAEGGVWVQLKRVKN